MWSISRLFLWENASLTEKAMRISRMSGAHTAGRAILRTAQETHAAAIRSAARDRGGAGIQLSLEQVQNPISQKASSMRQLRGVSQSCDGGRPYQTSEPGRGFLGSGEPSAHVQTLPRQENGQGRRTLGVGGIKSLELFASRPDGQAYKCTAKIGIGGR